MLTATADPSAPVESSGAASPRNVIEWLASTMPSGSFVAFRRAFGVLVVVSQIRFVARGWVDTFLLDPEHHLGDAGLGWLPAPTPLLVWTAIVTTIAAGLAIALGRATRVAAVCFVISFGFLETIDSALYLNHYWFLTLAAVVLAVVPHPTGGRIPWVSIVALRSQLAVVYLFAGLAKINSDWLLRAEPLATWLPARADRPIVGSLLEMRVTAFAASWAGALFDLTIVGWLLWRRSRPVAYVVLVVFHLATAALFQIGMFPWVMIALTPIFFAPDWTRRLRPRIGLQRTGARDEATVRPIGPVRWAVLAALAVVNVALPLRHFAADGNVRWNDDGYLFSWRVMLTERVVFVEYEITDPATGTERRVRPGDVLDEWQESSAVRRPDLVLATAHLLADIERSNGVDDPEVRAHAWVAWNGRPSVRWIDPTVDLADVRRSDSHASFVLPEPVEIAR